MAGRAEAAGAAVRFRHLVGFDQARLNDRRDNQLRNAVAARDVKRLFAVIDQDHLQFAADI